METSSATIATSEVEAGLTHLLIIGSMKCGTSTLFDILATHPKVLPSFTKEPEYFTGGPPKGAKRVEQYSDLWRNEDTYQYDAALAVLDGHHAWLENGIMPMEQQYERLRATRPQPEAPERAVEEPEMAAK